MGRKQVAVDADEEDLVFLAGEAERQGIPMEELISDIVCRLANSIRAGIDPFQAD